MYFNGLLCVQPLDSVIENMWKQRNHKNIVTTDVLKRQVAAQNQQSSKTEVLATRVVYKLASCSEEIHVSTMYNRTRDSQRF